MTNVNAVTKKVIGTSFLVLITLATILAISGRASALFSFLGNDLSFTGTVTQVSASSIQVDKGGTYPFVIVLAGDTVYSGGVANAADIEVGDEIKVDSREDQGMLVAKEIQSATISGYGYGSSCSPFTMSEVWVSSIESDFIYFSRANITITATYDTNSQIMPGAQSIDDLEPGEIVSVVGNDCEGDGIYVQSIIRGELPDEGETEISCNSPNAIVIRNTQVLLSHDEGGAFTPLASVDIANGVYDVYGVSFDHHSANAWDTLANESWYAEMYSDEELIATTGSTDDLPNSIDRNVTMIGSEVELFNITDVRFAHSAFVDPTYNSILPECLVLMPVQLSEESPEELPIEELL